jgi:hypothetical protein
LLAVGCGVDDRRHGADLEVRACPSPRQRELARRTSGDANAVALSLKNFEKSRALREGPRGCTNAMARFAVLGGSSFGVEALESWRPAPMTATMRR